MYTFYTVLPFSSQLFLHRGAIIFISQLPAEPRVHLRVLSHRFIFSGRFSKFVALRNYFERPASSRILTSSVSFSPFIVLSSFLNRVSLVRLRALSSGSRGFISRSFSKFVRSCALAIISALSCILCLASSSLFLSSSFLLRFISLSALLSQTPLTWCSPYRCGNSRLDCV